MNEQENVQKVQAMYAAYHAGDVDAILNALTEDVEWIFPENREIPYARVYRGRTDVREFFTGHASNVEVEKFEAQQYIAQGDQVVVLGIEAGRAKSTGKRYQEQWAMVFTFRGRQVARWQAYEDTAAVAAAFRQ